MTRRGIIIASFVGLLFAAIEAVLIPATLSAANTAIVSTLVAVLTVAASGISGRVILGAERGHRYYRLAIPILAAVSALAFESAVTNWLISQRVEFGPAPTALAPAVVVALIIGALAYLGAATVYGFAGGSQGVPVGARVGLLVLLLVAVLPGLNVLGLIGFVVTALARKPVTPAPAAASE
jgi:hypothetical protein